MALFQIEVFQEFCLQGSANPGILINIRIYSVLNEAKDSISMN